MEEMVLEQELIKQGDSIEFRKVGGWQGEEGPWRSGTLEGDTGRCWQIRGADGEVHDYWKHRVEIRKRTN